MTVTGRVFNIQRFSIHDGPGIRTSIFLKGCNLTAPGATIPNPVKPGQEIQYFPQKCELCMSVRRGVPDRRALRAAGWPEGVRPQRVRSGTCGECVKSCLYDALVFVMKTMTVDQVVEK